jgi:major membrane immunogen (membrane-anchored lipoprotein)
MAAMIHRTLAAALLGAAALALGACGTDDPTSGSGDGGEAKAKQAALDFARCVRKHGVDMPDPVFDDGGGIMQRSGENQDPEKARKAEKACEHYRSAVKPPKLSAAEQKAFHDAALANARCMRKHGIDFPDPTFNEDGGATLHFRTGSGGADPDDADFQAAQKACAATMPKLERK